MAGFQIYVNHEQVNGIAFALEGEFGKVFTFNMKELEISISLGGVVKSS